MATKKKPEDVFKNAMVSTPTRSTIAAQPSIDLAAVQPKYNIPDLSNVQINPVPKAGGMVENKPITPTANLSEFAKRRIQEDIKKNPHRGETFQIGSNIVSYEEYLKAMAVMGKPQRDQTPEDTAYLASVGDVTSQNKIAEQQRQEELLNRIGQVEQPANMQVTPLNWNEVALSTATKPSSYKTIGEFTGGGALIGGTVGAKLGAALGTAITPGLGTAAGAGIGLAAGIGISILGNIRSQKTGDIKAQQKVLSAGGSNLNSLISLIKTDPENADVYIRMYNEQMARISEAYSQLKLDTESNLNLALSQDGTVAMMQYENFYAPGGDKQFYDAKLIDAITRPTPGAVPQNLLIDNNSLYSNIEAEMNKPLPEEE